MENYKILLNKNRSKKSINTNNSLTARLKSSKKLLPVDPISAAVSEISIYNRERENCSNIRLTVNVNPICSNVLFNNITEIVKDEGTKNVKCLNYDYDKGKYTDDDFSNLVYKDSNVFYNNEDRILNAIRDTQLSNIKNDFKYHCGIDIFNNHIMRSKTFKTICPLENGKDPFFNTIKDKMRTHDGKQIMGYSDNEAMLIKGKPDIEMHMYLNEEIESYKESVDNNLIEENGWFGFTNKGKMKVYPKPKNDVKDFDWFKIINSRKPCDFIDLYPERDLFYFDPKYNSFKKRVEKNWHYCITYPSSDTYKENIEIPFIKRFGNQTTLMAMYFDDNIKNYNGTDAIKIYSVSKHGLKENDYVNLYVHYGNQNERVLSNARVIKVEDPYAFYVFRDGTKISNKWVNIKEYDDGKSGKLEEIKVNVDVNTVKTFKVSNDKKYIYEENTPSTKYYIINNEKVNIDEKAQKLSYVRVVNSNEVKYYVRLFSKLPNWKYSKYKIDEDILEKNPEYIKEYQTIENEFENHIGKLAYSRNIYNDNIGEIVFTDNIDINYLKDNLNRPLSDLYLTIIKNNEGYREWYGKRINGTGEIDIRANNVEYSHCFGKLNCAFKLSTYSFPNADYSTNILLLNNSGDSHKKEGLDMSLINDRKNKNNINKNVDSIIENDEIQYNSYKDDKLDAKYSGDSVFYGDLCCYSTELCDEQIIQDVNFRFNTAQRELTDNFAAKAYINDIKYDEIISDDYDEGENVNERFQLEDPVPSFDDAANRKEGYYYKAHYRIRIKTFSSELNTKYPRFIKAKTIQEKDEMNLYRIYSMGYHDLGDKEYIYVYDNEREKLYKAKVIIPLDETNPRLFELKIENDSQVFLNKTDFILFKKYDNIPEYASFKKDGSCRYIWRELLQNGFDNNSEIEIYPYTNNALYINKSLNLYLRRQDPSCTSILRSLTYPYGIPSEDKHFEKENKYYNEEDIIC